MNVFIYAALERAFKELWVMSDSHRKSFGIFRNIIETQGGPMLVLDKSGKIMYTNK